MFTFLYVIIFLGGGFAALYVLDVLLQSLRRRKFINKLPPLETRYRFMSHTLELLCSPEELFRKVRQWNLKHFPIFVVNPGLYMSIHISGPEEVEALVSSTKNMEKAKVYEFLHNWLGEGLLTSTGTKWQSRRKILTPAFHFSILQQFLITFNKEAEKMVEKLEIRTREEPSIDVLPVLSDVTLHTINETAMGIVLDVKRKEDQEYKQSLYEVSQLFLKRIQKPWYYLPFFWYTSASGWRELQVTKILHRFTSNVIKDRFKNFKEFVIPTESQVENDVDNNYFKKKKMAMLDILLNAQVKEGSIDSAGIRDEVNTFMFEGHDTTAMSLTFTLMLLACHKEIQQEVYQEIIHVLGDSRKSPSYNELQQLQLMERCVKESLRMYPSVPFIGRIISEDIHTKHGILPKGAFCHVHIYDLHRNPNVWPEPDVFNPDRFLLENCTGRHPYAYIPFSAGPRNCIGQRFAILEIKSILVHILRKFQLDPVDTPETLVLIQDLVLRPKDGLRVKFTLRSS